MHISLFDFVVSTLPSHGIVLSGKERGLEVKSLVMERLVQFIKL